MNKIQSIVGKKSINYSDAMMSCFWEKQAEVEVSQKNNSHEFIKEMETILEDLTDSIICLQTEQLVDNRVVELLYNTAKNNNKIYVITNEKDESLKQLQRVCLIRYGVNNIGSFLLLNPNSNDAKGFVINSPLIESSIVTNSILLHLEQEQIKDLFRFFSYNFWNKTTKEIIDSFDTPQDVGDRPIDFFEPSNNSCDIKYLKKTLAEQSSQITRLSIPNINENYLSNLGLRWQDFLNMSIFTGLKDNVPELLRVLSDNGCMIRANNLNDGDFFTSEVLFPKFLIASKDNLFGIELSDDQKDFLKKRFLKNYDNSEWCYYNKKSRFDLSGKEILYNDKLKEVVDIKDVSKKQLNTINCDEFRDKNYFEGLKPEDFPDDEVSCKINYEWNIVPFQTPEHKKCTKDSIYKEWRDYDESFVNKVQALNNHFEDLGKRKEGLAEKLSGMMKRFFLGKNKAIEEHKNEILDFSDVKLSKISRDERKKNIHLLNEKIAFINDSNVEISTEIDKGEQKIDWENKKTNLERKRSELRETLRKEEDVYRKSKEKYNEELEEKKLDKKQELDKLKERSKIEDIDKYESENTKKIQGKHFKKKNIQEFNQIKSVLSEIDDIQNPVKIFTKKNSDDFLKKESEINKIKSDLSLVVKELEIDYKEFKFSSRRQNISDVASMQKKSERRNSNTLSKFIVKTIEELPSTGTLFEYKKDKYLEIEFWEEVEEATKEAKRFKAKLSVKREANNG